MACKGCFEWLLKLLNFLLTLVGLAMIGYGSYLFVEYKRVTDDALTALPVNGDIVDLGRPMLIAVSFSTNFLDKLPKAWFIILFIAVGVVLFIISCIGCIAAVTRSGCCLVFYSVLLVLLICVELACAGFIYFDKSWEEEIPTDKTGDFHMIYDFLKQHLDIVKWVALGCLILEALVFLLTLVVRSANKPLEYDSDDEFISPRQQIRQPFLNRPPAPASGVPVSGSMDQHGGRNDAWSARMREKYGLDTSDFTHNLSDSQRHQQVTPQPTEEKSRCAIM
ncbi:tobamovirus multiplication protein 2A-like [Rutidosis leptorrhynchoides]|uniref:tobamovirus multiplication protein 2A-like n=1 Tax=Rutidosis leptorrhynchoides TaxID=125765 RepID=UPI003A99DE42